jgi:hypothetical protein
MTLFLSVWQDTVLFILFMYDENDIMSGKVNF